MPRRVVTSLAVLVVAAAAAIGVWRWRSAAPAQKLQPPAAQVAVEIPRTEAERRFLEELEARWPRFEDIEYQFSVVDYPVDEPAKRSTQLTELKWVPAKGWELRRRHVIDYSGINQFQVEGWAGEDYKQSADELAGTARRSGTTSARPQFGVMEPLTLMRVRGGVAGGPSEMFPEMLRPLPFTIDGTEMIDGHITTVITVNPVPSMPEPIYMKYWLDMERGGMPLRIETSQNGRINNRFTEIELQEVRPSVFLPIRLKVELGMDAERRKQFKGSYASIHEFSISPGSVKVNQGLKQSDFDVAFAPGTPVWNQDFGTISHHQPTASQRLQDLEVNTLRKIRAPAGPGAWSAVRVAGWVIAATIVIAGMWLVSRMFRRTGPPTQRLE